LILRVLSHYVRSPFKLPKILLQSGAPWSLSYFSNEQIVYYCWEGIYTDLLLAFILNHEFRINRWLTGMILKGVKVNPRLIKIEKRAKLAK
jgi:hypothetical protein